MLVQHLLHSVLVDIPDEEGAVAGSGHHVVAIRAVGRKKMQFSETAYYEMNALKSLLGGF